MKELLDLSMMGFNIPSTLLLGFITLYWLSVIIGMLDLDFLDVEIDIDGEAELSFGETILAFANVGKVPLMIILSIIAVFMWTGSILLNAVLNPTSNTLIGIGVLIAIFIGAVFVTKIVSLPLVRLFAQLDKEAHNIDMVGKVCDVILPIDNDHMGQGEVMINSNSILVNIKSWKQEKINRGEKALIIDHDEAGNVYSVEKYKEL